MTERIALSSFEWRAYLVALLAGVYAAVWLATAPSSPAPAAPPAITLPRASPAPARHVAAPRPVRIRTRSS